MPFLLSLLCAQCGTRSGKRTTPNGSVVGSIFNQEVCYDFRWAGDSAFVLGFDVLAAEQSRINGPRPRADHCGTAGKSGQHDRNQRVAGSGKRDPEFDHGSEGSHDWGPEANEKKDPGAGTKHLREHRWRMGCPHEIDHPQPKQQEGS